MRLAQKRTSEGLSRYVCKLLKTIRHPNAATTSKAPDTLTSKREKLSSFPVVSRGWEGAESDEGIEVFGGAEGVHPEAGQ